MKNTFKKLTEEIKATISAQLQSKEIQDFVAATKAAEDSGSFEVVISTADVDRDGESIDQNGWDLSFYQMNPIVLWAHDYSSLPIGVCENIAVKDGKLVAAGKFAPESANPFAQQVRRLYDLKIVRATSVGFVALEMDGRAITKAQLLEFSFVPVPANPYALTLSKAVEMGLNTAMLAMKGIKFEEAGAKKDLPETSGDNPDEQQPAEPQEGADCTMPDGSPGMIIDDGGQLICVPKYEEKPEVTANYIRIPTKDAAGYDSGSIRTIDIDAAKGIKALTACPKGEYTSGKCGVGTEIITYLFDKNKWSETEAQAWVDAHKKGATPPSENDHQIVQDALDNLAEELKTAAAVHQDRVKSAVVAHNNKVKTAVVVHMQKILEIVQSHYGIPKKETIQPKEASSPKGGAGEEQQGGAAPKQRSSSAGYDDKEALDEFLSGRQVLRLVNNVTSEALRKLNERSRPKTYGSKRS